MPLLISHLIFAGMAAVMVGGSKDEERQEERDKTEDMKKLNSEKGSKAKGCVTNGNIKYRICRVMVTDISES